MLSFKSITLLFTQLPVQPLTKYLKQQQFSSIDIILYTSYAYNNNCSIHLYSRDLLTTIILFSRNVPSHKTDWILTGTPFPALFCLLYHKSKQSDEFTCMKMSLRNLHKCKQVVYCVFHLRLSLESCCCLLSCASSIFILHSVVACLFLCPLIFFFIH